MTGCLKSAVSCTAFAVASILCLLPKAATAGAGSYWAEQSRNYLRDSQDAAGVLQSKAQGDWTDQELEKYLFSALYAVYCDLEDYLHTQHHHPATVEDLQTSGFISATDWPKNPLNNWEPITWADASGGFSPCNLVRQLCPPSEYSGIANPHPMTYTLGIYGPNTDYRPINPPPVMTLFDWDVELDGIAFITGSRFSTTEELKKKKEAADKRREEAKKAEAEKEGADKSGNEK